MARQSNQKLKLLYLQQILLRQTDEEHGLSLMEISKKLEAFGITVDRKILYQDLDELRNFGMDIIMEKKGRNVYYYVASRDFELPELKLLVDSVQSSRFITEKKSNELIGKLEGLVSINAAKQLHRQVIISGRVKSMNESIYYNVDEIQTAIGENRAVCFKYFQWNVKKEMVLRHNGKIYTVSPWALVWDDENYYLVGFDHSENKIKHYRVDKMRDITMSDKTRMGKEAFDAAGLPQYSRKMFSMFAGDAVRVTIEADDSLAGVFIDRFGKDTAIMPLPGGRMRVIVDVEASDHFLGWIIALGPCVVIKSPETLRIRMRNIAEKVMNIYSE